MLRFCALVVACVACDAGSPPKPPAVTAPPPAAPVAKAVVAAVPDAWAVPPTRHKHAVRTVDLAKAELGKVELPKHGIVFKSWGLGGDSTFVLDSDANTSREIANLTGKGHSDRHRTLAPAAVQTAMTTAFIAWEEEPTGPMPSATDVREDLYIVDGDEAFYLSGYPIAIDGVSGRPGAAALLQALAKLVPAT